MILQLDKITKKYGDRVVLEKFSYEFKDKGLYILSGPSGIGKTTLLRIICGLDKNYDGSVLTPKPLRFSFCFQEYRLFPHLNTLQNIILLSYNKASEDDVSAAKAMLKKLSFTDDEMDLYPKNLSGGMKQRVSFARAVLNDANVLLLDEPTKEVDDRIANAMLEIIENESKKRLVIMVTHKIEDLTSLSASVIKIGAQN